MQAGVAVSKWAIEYEQPAADAFKLNNPDAAVFCNNCNAILVVSTGVLPRFVHRHWLECCQWCQSNHCINSSFMPAAVQACPWGAQSGLPVSVKAAEQGHSV